MNFEEELSLLLPADLPHREACVSKASRHLHLIVEMNRKFNLTRIVDPREAAIKHVVDSILPWRLFAEASHVVDAGTGAGFPGIPLALVLPETRFTLLESTQKKARFVESVDDELELANVHVSDQRAEDWLKRHRVDIVTARAVAPLHRAMTLFSAALRGGGRMLLYKGPDAEVEMREADKEAAKRQVRMRVVGRYELPDSLGARTIVELAR
ncbi:MAG TPA: 16S rRNA (guanine(527)-N(7))-methyltransferase RsmG [Bryobacteraceae bacterium]|nr:16S rRNA (guanine(527)-N(7))-methyltransferase RsmG [Bryobacteraceae bacterium]